MKGTPTLSSQESMTTLVNEALEYALQLGSTAAVAEVSDESGLNVNVRNQQVETIEHTRDRSFEITVYSGFRRASASSGDLSSKAIQKTVYAAVEMSRFTSEDVFSGLPDQETLCKHPRNLDLFHPWEISAEEAINIGIEAERAAQNTDCRISNSEGASVSTSSGRFVLANTLGFCSGFPFSHHSIYCSVIAEENDEMQLGSWFSGAVVPQKMLTPLDLGTIAGQRAVARLGSRTIKTQKCPVVFEAPVARSLFASFNRAISGSSLYRKASFLCDRLDTPVLNSNLSITENPFMASAYGSAPFDDEGVEPKERFIVEGGILKGLFLSSYSARKLGMRSTGNAGGPYNLLYKIDDEASEKSLDSLLQRMGRGLLVTELIGQGVNLTTGDFSKGASGFWVENGRIAYPVEGITVAGNLNDMFLGIEAMAQDFYTNGSIFCGSILIKEMTIAGK